MTKNHALNKVFTPSSPARITFVEREKVNNRIVRALKTPGMQIVIYGHTGSGKTTLLENKLYETYEKHIRTNCMKGMTFDQIILDAFDQLAEFYIDEVTNKRKESINANAKASYLLIRSELSTKSEDEKAVKEKRVLPPQLTAQSLARLMGQAGYCWVIEDFHKIEVEHKERLSQMMKVFMDMSDSYQDLKIIAIGAVNTAREVVQYDNDMRQRVTEIHVELMNTDEIKEIIHKGCEALNVRISQELSNDIARYSNGLASACHKICYILCDSADIYSTLKVPVTFNHDDLQNAISEYLSDTSDTIKCAFDKALKLKGAEDILWGGAKIDGDGANLEDLLVCIKENRQSKLTCEKLRDLLESLGSELYGECIKYDQDSARYSFSNPFLCSFARAYFEEKEKTLTARKNQILSKEESVALLDQALRMFMKSYAHSPNTFIEGEATNDEPLTDGRE